MNEEVAVFDPDLGTFLFSRNEAIDRNKLSGELLEDVEACSYQGYYVIDVHY